MKKKNLVLNLMKSVMVLGITGGMVFQTMTAPHVVAETVQVASYTLTEEEKTVVKEYLEAKMSIAMHEFYVAYWEEMNTNASSGFVNKALEEAQADIGEGLTSEQAALFAEVQSTLAGSINQHFHYMLETEKVMGGYGIPAAEAIVAEYDNTEENTEELAPEVELALAKYSKEVILEMLNKLNGAIEGYINYSKEAEADLLEVLSQDSIDKDALFVATTQYGQALVTASRPVFPYDFTELDARIAELTKQLQPTTSNNETGNVVDTSVISGKPEEQSGQDNIGNEQDQEEEESDSGDQNKVLPTNTAGKAKVLPKTASTTGALVSLLGFLVGAIGIRTIKTKVE